VIKKEITRVLVVGFIKEFFHLEWVVNPYGVQKENNECRMCVDYIDLNDMSIGSFFFIMN
jgi:hypothetical protein